MEKFNFIITLLQSVFLGRFAFVAKYNNRKQNQETNTNSEIIIRTDGRGERCGGGEGNGWFQCYPKDSNLKRNYD